MSALILAVDSGLDGAFVWMRGGIVLHTLLTRNIAQDGRINMRQLELDHRRNVDNVGALLATRIAYLEEPFNPGMTGRANSVGFAGSCKRFGRLQGWLESWGYEVRSVRPQEWQRGVLDLGRFEVRTEKACAPRLAEGWALKKSRTYNVSFTLTGPGQPPHRFGSSRDRAWCMRFVAEERPEAIVTTKSILSHDTKAASIAYARERFPGVELVPPRCKNPHDGLADALCIAAWASKKETP